MESRGELPPIASGRPRTERPGDARPAGLAVARPSLVVGCALTLIVLTSAVVRLLVGLGMPSTWVLPDELVYSDLARSIAEGGRPAVRDVSVFGWGEVYPAVISPVWALVEDRYVAYHVTLALNAVLMSLAAIPAYFLARLVVSRASSLLVATMTVVAPSLSYTDAVLTENAFYPLFLTAVLAIAHAVRRPSPATQAAALVAVGLVIFTRVQGVAMLAAYAGAALLYCLTQPRRDRLPYARRFLPTLIVAIPVALAPVVASVARGEGVFGWLGQRSGTFDEFHLHEVPYWFLLLAVGLVLYVAVAPAVATTIMVVAGLRGGADDGLRLYAAVVLPTIVAMLLSVAFVSASFDVDGIGNLNERYVFHVVPLLFVGLALWIERGLPRPRPWSWLVLGVACLAPVLLPIDRLDYNAGLQALALVPWGALSLNAAGTALLVGLVTIGAGALWLTARPGATARIWALLAIWLAVLGVFVVDSNRASAGRTAAAFDGRAATWIDDAVPSGSRVAVLWDETRARKDLPDSFYFWLMVTEFFNDRVGDVYRLGPVTRYEDFLPTVPSRLAADGTLLAGGAPVRADYALVTCRTPVAGTEVAQAPRGALRLVRLDGPLRLTGDPGCRRREP
jgi:hypothetical protein